jgi:hypothetical protein
MIGAVDCLNSLSARTLSLRIGRGLQKIAGGKLAHEPALAFISVGRLYGQNGCSGSRWSCNRPSARIQRLTKTSLPRTSIRN